MSWPCGIGGVLVSAAGSLVSAFSEIVGSNLRVLVGEGAKKTIKCASLTFRNRMVRCESASAELADLANFLSGKKG